MMWQNNKGGLWCGCSYTYLNNDIVNMGPLSITLIWVWLTFSTFLTRIFFYFNEKLPHHLLTK